MSQKLSVNGFKWVVDLFEFNEDFIKSYNEKSNEEYFLEVDAQYPNNLHEPHNDLSFLPEIKKIHNVKKLVANLRDKKIIYYTQRKFKTSISLTRISFERNS